MNETANKTIAKVAKEKNWMRKSVFDDELFDDVSSYDQNELHCGMGIPMEFSFYKDRGCINKGDSIRIDNCKMSEVSAELESLFGKLSCHNSANDFDLSADALVYEIIDSAETEMTKGDVLVQDDEIIKDFKPLGQPVPEPKFSSDLLVSSVVPENETLKRCFFDKILKAPKSKEYPVLAFDWDEQRIVFNGMYKLYPIESCMQQRVVMKFIYDTCTIK